MENYIVVNRKQTMSAVKRLVLDVLKPHHPNVLDFAAAIAEQNSGCRVQIKVEEVDEKTESTMVVIEGKDISYQAIVETIGRLGGSVHSIDEVEVASSKHSRHEE
jgi:hypothetical protein